MYTDIQMAKDQGPLSGFRDLSSAQMIAREAVLKTITEVYERYGFTPLKTPAIERAETLNGKYGEEAKTLIYEFEDRGGRKLALRYDHTVPLARYMATHSQSLPRPYKRYAVGDVWRGESPQAGRFREFAQIDADIVGSDSYLAEAETLAMMVDVFRALDVSVTIEVNDRRILDGLAEVCGVNEPDKFFKFISVIDKVTKIGVESVLKEIEEAFGAEAKDKVANYLSINSEQALDKIPELVASDKAKAGVENLRRIFDVLAPLGFSEIKFNPSIARGLNYYTSTIFETLVNDAPGLGSVCSGGRYDNLIGQLGGPDSPAVGTSIGLDRLMEAIYQLNKAEAANTKTEVYIANLDQSLDAKRLALAQKLRSAGIPTEIYYSQVKLGKQLEAIDKLGVTKVIIYGQDEDSKNIVLIKDLETSDQKEVPVDKLVEEFKK